MVRIVIAGIFLAGFGAAGWYLKDQLLAPETPTNSETSSDDSCGYAVNALGYLEPEAGVIGVSGPPGDRLAVLHVKVGDTIEEGQKLAELASKSLRELEWQSAKNRLEDAKTRMAAEKKAAEAQLAAAKVGMKKLALQDLEEQRQKAAIALLKKTLEQGQKNLDRMKELPDSLVSQVKQDEQELIVEKTKAELEVAESALEQMAAMRAHAKETAESQVTIAESAVEQVIASDPSKSLSDAVTLAKLQYDLTILKAPTGGEVLEIFLAEGESLGPRPVLQMADLTRMICRAEVYKTDIRCVKIGDPARVTSPAFPEELSESGLKGTVKRIRRLVAAPKLQSLDPYAAQDRHVITVDIEFDADASRIAARYVHLQVQVEIGPFSDDTPTGAE